MSLKDFSPENSNFIFLVVTAANEDDLISSHRTTSDLLPKESAVAICD